MPKVAVLGAAGGIGQPLALLLKASPLVTELCLFGITKILGVAADLSHVNTRTKVKGFLPPDGGLRKALAGADLVIITASAPMRRGITRDDLFRINAGIIRDLATGIALTSPKALILVISNPVNAIVPLVAEVLKQYGVFDPRRLFGATTLDVDRASVFVAEKLGDPTLAPSITVPVVCGHSGATIVPLFSQSSHPLPPTSDLETLTTQVQFSGDEVVKAKGGLSPATLSIAYAAAEFSTKLLSAINGETGITAATYVNLTADPSGGEAFRKELGKELDYFSTTVELGPNGVSRILPLGKITGFEKNLINAALPELTASIKKGVSFIAASKLETFGWDQQVSSRL